AAVEYFVSGDWNPAARQFIFNPIPRDGATDGSLGAKLGQENVFTHSCDAGSVAMKVDTIHSVKGEDLKAILVLETIFYKHDLRLLIEKGYLRVNRPPIRWENNWRIISNEYLLR
ncbi:MAG TPA: hypothetical protein VFB82_13145, partial [Blastocatellia bacterium]|nr:hypothetical protein [Blastocatellia bacterium]